MNENQSVLLFDFLSHIKNVEVALLSADKHATVLKEVDLNFYRKQILIVSSGFICLLLICSYSYAEKTNMIFRDVVTESPNHQGDMYVSLDRIYRYVNYGGVTPPKLLVNIEHALTLHPKDIELCSVQDLLFSPENLNVYQVAFKLNDNLYNTMKDFCNKRVGKTIAIEIGDKNIFTVVDVKEPFDVEFTVMVFGRTKQEIGSELSGVCEKVIVESGSK
jgi:hypothetical protein